ncbi:MAG: serine/threonine protein kinase/formylglycine-generating enzyme required for sulfatase activity [Pseudohongiellaceae bacterium]
MVGAVVVSLTAQGVVPSTTLLNGALRWKKPSTKNVWGFALLKRTDLDSPHRCSRRWVKLERTRGACAISHGLDTRAGMTTSHDTSDRARTRALLHAALDLPTAQRQAYLESQLLPGETLQDALSLIAEVDDLGDFLERPPTLPTLRVFQPALPERIGNYTVERVLGWGSMGVVYLAKQEAPSRPVALKVLRIDIATPTTAQRFAREGSVLARLSHPGIASVYESGIAELGAGQQPYLAMEYIDGVSVSHYAEQQGLDRRGRVALILPIARAIAHAHAHGVLHRDLKPENILVRKDGTPIVLDFGVAHTAAADNSNRLTLTVTGQVLGTLAYMAPEQARGVSLDARADQFALGVILFELLTGVLPMDVRGRLPHEALRIIADGDCLLPTKKDPTLAGDLEAMLMTALAPEPARRYPDVDAFADDLERWLNDDPVLARPPSRFETLRRFVARNRSLTLLVAAALITVGASISWATGALLDLRHEGAISLLFSDRRLLEELQLESADLWPTSRATLPAFDSWLNRAHDLTGRRAAHREAIQVIHEAESTQTASGLVFEDEWLLHEANWFVHATKAFSENLTVEIGQRRNLAAEIYRATVGDRLDAWQAVSERIHADPRFDGLRLPPQEGLVPLGPDPQSQLEEFALWLSGTVPERDGHGRIHPQEEHGLVFVLIPGGELLIGAQDADPAAANHDRLAMAHEVPPFPVSLQPFLISKYEMTQAQWLRAFGNQPSDWEIGSTIAGHTISGLHPVESISWLTIQELFPRLGLTLPTEAQWERAARGGSPWCFMVGPELTDLLGYANWKTHTAQAELEAMGIPDDGYQSHMPVGSLLPNGYGLHDVLGNVWEYCRDTYKVRYHDLEHRAGDGLVLTEPDGDVSRRGHSSALTPSLASVYRRSDKLSSGRDALTGVRPGRALQLQPRQATGSTSNGSDK